MNTHAAAIVFVLVCLAAAPAFAVDCDKPGACQYGKITERMNEHFEPSYITVAGGYDRSGKLRTRDILYEGQLYLHLNWYENCQDPEECGKDFYYRVFVPIRLQLRQYTTESHPVKTPSFNPGARVYFWHRSWVNGEDDFHYLSLGGHHYSNGQSGLHYLNGAINTNDGSFSTDYLELAYYREKGSLWGKVNYRQYLTGITWEEAQTDYYETALVELTGRGPLPWLDMELQLTAGYKFGRKYVSPGTNASFKDNLQFTAELVLPVSSWKDLSWYVRWDKGYDNYNIYYQNKVNRIQAGFVATTF